MAHRTKETVASQVQSACQDMQSSDGLPFQDLLSSETILAALERAGVEFRDRIFSPVVTVWAFLSQALAGKKGSCQNAVSRVLADRIARGQAPCSTDTTSYCAARGRLSLPMIMDLVREMGQGLHQEAPLEWQFKNRRVVIVDGSTATMDDTPENQKAFPQHKNQKKGLGFPMMRFVVLLSLSVGTALECAVGPCRGKKTGEQSLFRQTWNVLQAGDIVLGDRLYDAYRDTAQLKARGVDTLFGKKQSRNCDFRKGRRLGKDDHVVVWKRPKYDSTRYDTKEEWEALPEEIEIRETRATVRRKGYRTRRVIIVTTLLDPELYSAKELTDLFAERWHCELDLRSIKQSLGMHHLRCKTPKMVLKELWVYLLAYNLIRVRMAQAAAVHEEVPRKLSFTAAMNHIENFGRKMENTTGAEYSRLEAALLAAISTHKVGNRPGRKEPRAVKKRTQTHPNLTKPRDQARKQLTA